MRPFLRANVDAVQPPPPPTFSTDPASVFYTQALEVYAVCQQLTPAERTIAEFWSDDPGKTATPPGHSLSVMVQVLDREHASLQLAGEACARMGMAAHDAFISC
ncbi:MAG: hypothetical protein OHK0039_33570 [Bacteroidia bacterium]